jgi:putative ABC transport system substrate-binding protein
VDGLRQGLVDLGWVDGRTMVIESRFAEGKTDQLPRLAAELVPLQGGCDRHLVHSRRPWRPSMPPATVPIVIGFVADPVGSGIVASLARPGGNITGWTHSGRELRAKYLELIKAAVPGATRIGVLWNPANQVHQPSMQNIEAAARAAQGGAAPGRRAGIQGARARRGGG